MAGLGAQPTLFPSSNHHFHLLVGFTPPPSCRITQQLAGCIQSTWLVDTMG